MNQQFTFGTLESMNYSYPQNGSITNTKSLDKNKMYELHATGDADLNGRKYISLPADMIITDQVKRMYNLM